MSGRNLLEIAPRNPIPPLDGEGGRQLAAGRVG